MSDTKMVQDVDGLAAWSHLLDRMPVLLEQLLAAPETPVEEHGDLPEAPGVYLLSSGDRPMLVDHAADLNRQLAEVNERGGKLDISGVAYLLGRPAAIQTAIEAGDFDLQYQSRERVEAKAAAEIFERAQEEVSMLSLQVMPHEDYLEGKVFAAYAELTLQARIVNPSRWI